MIRSEVYLQIEIFVADGAAGVTPRGAEKQKFSAPNG
jgi:hypothetical protein